MFFSRLISLFYVLFSFNLLVSAIPLYQGGLTLRGVAIRTETAGQELIDALKSARTRLIDDARKLDGIQNPSATLVSDLENVTKAITKINFKAGITNGQIAISVSYITDIVFALVSGLSKYDFRSLHSISPEIDSAMASFLRTSADANKALRSRLYSALIPDYSIFLSVKLDSSASVVESIF